jgi:outer membrane protein OmpA-like peptidoglycan-associated protein
LLARATKGSMLVSEGRIQLSVQVPTEAVADRIKSEIETVTGLPVVVEGREVTNLESPELVVAGQRGQISLSGKVPTQEIWDAVNGSATAKYGQFGVTNQVVVDEKVHTALWMYDPAGLFEALYVFPELDIVIQGETVTGDFRGGYTFERGEEQAIPENDAVTGFIVDLMARDPSLQMFITAHTDSDGADADNLALSEGRAAYVFGLFRDEGVDEARIEAAGKGESAPIVVDEQTDEDRSRNRRIEVQLTTKGGS